MADKEKKLTRREEMVRVIESGQSVMWNHKVFTKVADLPPDDELAAGDVGQLTLSKTDLENQIADLQSRLDRVNASIEEASSATSKTAKPANK